MTEKPDFKKMKKDELLTLLEDHWKQIAGAQNSLATIAKHSQTVNDLVGKSNDAWTQIETTQTKVTTSKKAIDETLASINTIKADVKDSLTNITDFYNELFDDSDEKVCTEAKINQLKKSFEEELGNLQSQSTEIQNEEKKKFSDLQTNFEAQLKTKFESVEARYHILFEKIESLLPSATSAGLAGSYKEAKTEINTKLLWGAFIVVVGLLFGWYAYFVYKTPTQSLGAIVAHVLTGSPLIWLAWYLQRTLSQQRRIYQEYSHKQRVMNLYEGFVKAIHESGSEDQKIQLLNIMLKTVESNPANGVGGQETLLENLMEKLPIPKVKNKNDQNKPNTGVADDE